MIMRKMPGAIFAVLIMGVGVSVFAEDTKVKGVEIVPDTATAIVNKANALLTGNLECTMTIGKDKYRNDYDMDPQGRKIPR